MAARKKAGGSKKKGGGQPSDTVDVTPQKAGEILREGEVQGHRLTPPQRGMFGAIRGRAGKKGGGGSKQRGKK